MYNACIIHKNYTLDGIYEVINIQDGLFKILHVFVPNLLVSSHLFNIFKTILKF